MENSNIDDITLKEVLYDLERQYSHAKQVYEGFLDGRGLSKDGAFRRMQVANYAIQNLKDKNADKLVQNHFVCPLCHSNHNTDYGSDIRECTNCGKHFKK